MPKTKSKSAAKKPSPKRALSSARRTRGKRNWWTDDERRAILAAVTANGGNVAKTARETGVPESTIYCWVGGHRCPEALQLRNDKGGNLANACEELAWLFAAAIPGKVESAPLNHCTAGLGIMVEKMKLLRGEPTTYGRTDNTNKNVSLNLERLPPDERAVFLRLLAMVAGTADAGGGEGGRRPERVPEPAEPRHKVAGVLGEGVPDR